MVTLEKQVNHLLALIEDAASTLQEEIDTNDQEHPRLPLLLQDAPRLFSRLRSARSHDVQTALERRGFPLGTTTVKQFADQHRASVYEVKNLYKEGKIALSVVAREARRNKQEWWITPAQMFDLVQYWQDHTIPYTPCSRCPHSMQHSSTQAG